tara:strand:- start:1770 stop:3107 length:1338 start_codon:yes stop_codon:yes gene_type:complete
MIYLISIIVVLISYFLFKSVAGSMALNRLNMISIIFYFYLIFMSYLGTVFIANGFGENPVLNKVSSQTRVFGWIVISYVMIGVPIGIRLSKYFFKIKCIEKTYNNYVYGNIVSLITKKDSYIKLPLYILSFFCLLSTFYVIYIVGKIPQVNFFNFTSQVDALIDRNEISRGFKGIYAIKSVFFEQLTPLLSLISYAYFRMTNSIKDRIWFYFMLFLTLFMLTFTLAKSPLISYGIMFVILKIYIDGYIKWKYFLVSSILGLFGIIFMFSIVARGTDINVVLYFLFNRIFFDQISGTFLMFEIFPSYNDFIGFTSLSKPISNLFFESYSEPATRLAMEYAFPVATEQGLMNLLSTLFIGEAWANFGWFGLIISPIYIGLIVGVFYYFILTSRKTPIFLGLLTYFSFRVNFSSQFNPYLYNSSVFIIAIIFFSSYIYALLLKQLRIN